jgi:hypothetical protein
MSSKMYKLHPLFFMSNRCTRHVCSSNYQIKNKILNRILSFIKDIESSMLILHIPSKDRQGAQNAPT